ncbi:MAG: hypothetical protein OEV64_06085 [Desulfobulbaceae bacterium]|nr:hypothetical protein [Desulfobulbaceae bacterium]
MKMKHVKKIAESYGIKTDYLKKTDLIRAIQNHEGNSPCIQSGVVSCDQLSCCWRDDCLPEGSIETMHLSKKDQYVQRIKHDIQGLKNNIEELKEKASEMVGKSKIDALNELKRLEKISEEEIKLKLHEVTEASEDAWNKTKKGIDHSLDNLRKTFKTISNKVRKHKKVSPN